jgi:hypothetical protein
MLFVWTHITVPWKPLLSITGVPAEDFIVRFRTDVKENIIPLVNSIRFKIRYSPLLYVGIYDMIYTAIHILLLGSVDGVHL